MNFSGGGGLGWRITHCIECEHIRLADEISLLAIDGGQVDVLGEARGGDAGGVLGD